MEFEGSGQRQEGIIPAGVRNRALCRARKDVAGLEDAGCVSVRATIAVRCRCRPWNGRLSASMAELLAKTAAKTCRPRSPDWPRWPRRLPSGKRAMPYKSGAWIAPKDGLHYFPIYQADDRVPFREDYSVFFWSTMENFALQVLAGSSKASPLRSPCEAWK